MQTDKKANRLAREKSPYLLQHSRNPVDWYPWGEEAFSKAAAEDKPVFLSIGYSTCHWCHVMEKECFEDNETAQKLNASFISIKVDREERPDIDHIYMAACQAFTGSGGWPLTVFLTPEGEPFFAGSYFPKVSRGPGMPGLLNILDKVTEAWKNSRDVIMESGNEITRLLNITAAAADSNAGIDEKTLSENLKEAADSAFKAYSRSFDTEYGGFGPAPKFPAPHNLLFLLGYFWLSDNKYALEMAEKTLDGIISGGINDHIGFGFCRYSTDYQWLVPHFEKMLYDNALLAIACLEAYQASGKIKYAETAENIFTYILRDMTSPEGGFYSAEDADSEGVEGKFYIWKKQEVIDALGKIDGAEFCRIFDITDKGNFKEAGGYYSIPNLIKKSVQGKDKAVDKAFIEECRQKLFLIREKRVHPFKDDKILTGWNGLMIAAMAMGGRITGKQKYTEAAEKAAAFIFTRLVREDGRLLARWREGESAIPAYCEDYAFIIWGLIELYETTYKPEYLKKALKLTGDMINLFEDKQNGGFYMTGNDSEKLIARPKSNYDAAIPSANSAAAMNLLKLSGLTGRIELTEKALTLFRAAAADIAKSPRGFSYFLSAALFLNSQPLDIVIAGNADNTDIDDFIDIIRKYSSPFSLSLLYTEKHRELSEIAPFTGSFKPAGGKTTAYVCRNFTCLEPVTDAEKLRNLLENF